MTTHAPVPRYLRTKLMTADELIATLQKFTPEQRQREVWMEADAGYAEVGDTDLVRNEKDEETICIIPVSRGFIFKDR